VTALVAGRPLEWRRAADRLAVRIPELRLFEAIRIRPH
jgi:hypothetical protein